jgi:hypothetical protein
LLREKTRRDQQTAALLYAMRNGTDLDEICELVTIGANPNAIADGVLWFLHL